MEESTAPWEVLTSFDLHILLLGQHVHWYPWENMMVPIAEWMGVDESQHGTVFPNLAKFNKSTHILATQLTKSFWNVASVY